MPVDRTQEMLKEILDDMNAVANMPCTNKHCADCDGKCARKNCGGYTVNKKCV